MTVLQNIEDNSLKTPIVDNMMGFISSAEQVALARSWIEKGYIHPQGDAEKSLYALV